MIINLRNFRKNKKIKYLNLVYPYIIDNCENYYKDVKDWFNRVKKDLLKKNGIYNILLDIKDNNLRGFCIIKNSKIEKKICTLYVLNEFRRLHIGRNLCIESCNVLGTKYPSITIPEDKINIFCNFFKYFDWKETRKEIYYN